LLSSAKLQDYLYIVQREAERLGALVDDLLSLARTEAGELHLDIEPVVAADVVEEIFETMAPLAHREREVALVRKVDAHLPPVLADRQRLSQVLLNLVRNAITYTPNGGIVSITVERPDTAYLALVVADTGIGIPPEDLERVFERFYRTDASRARTTGGFGLGLAIVRDLVNAMGGSVTVSSKVDEGSCFRVLLRVATPTYRALASTVKDAPFV
jgi:signal transduction histidine kinase